VITAGLHGNEPAGVIAARAVLDDLASLRAVLCGQVVAFAGNRPALARRVRYVVRDLNRRWRQPELDRLRASPLHDLRAEDREQCELHEAFLLLEREAASLTFLDLHTTSGPTQPFVCFADTSDNRSLACALPVAVVLGLERTIGGTMLSWCSERGHAAISFEAGQHDEPAARVRHVAAIWTLLVALGAIDAADVPSFEAHEAVLTQATHGRSRVVEVLLRHVVREGDDFQMLAGFKSFDPVGAGQIVAYDRSGPVRAPQAGLMLMPRYQGVGEDGFFVAREIGCSTG
jgi:succinylglutamate desuccinylase